MWGQPLGGGGVGGGVQQGACARQTILLPCHYWGLFDRGWLPSPEIAINVDPVGRCSSIRALSSVPESIAPALLFLLTKLLDDGGTACEEKEDDDDASIACGILNKDFAKMRKRSLVERPFFFWISPSFRFHSPSLPSDITIPSNYQEPSLTHTSLSHRSRHNESLHRANIAVCAQNPSGPGEEHEGESLVHSLISFLDNSTRLICYTTVYAYSDRNLKRCLVWCTSTIPCESSSLTNSINIRRLAALVDSYLLLSKWRMWLHFQGSSGYMFVFV